MQVLSERVRWSTYEFNMVLGIILVLLKEISSLAYIKISLVYIKTSHSFDVMALLDLH